MAVDQVEPLIPLKHHSRMTRVGAEGSHPVGENKLWIVVVIDNGIVVQRCFESDADIDHIVDVVDTHPLHQLLEKTEPLPPGCDNHFRGANRFRAGDDHPGTDRVVEDIAYFFFQGEAHPPILEFVHEAPDKEPAAVGADVGLADVEESYPDTLGPPPVDLQVLFLLNDRLQMFLYLWKEPFCFFLGPVLSDKADRVRVVLFAVVQQAAGTDPLTIDHENRKRRRNIGEMKGGAKPCRAGADNNDVEIGIGHV